MSSNEKMDELSTLLADLKEEQVLAIVRERMASGMDPLAIIDACQTGMRRIGQYYEKGTYFISGLIIAGEIMREIGKLILPLIASNIQGHDSGTILLGTVEGDIHFIGKDVFKVLARCHGFKVFDLGVNVPPGEFLTAVRKTTPRIIGLSCLLSSCFEAARNTIALIRQEAAPSRPLFLMGGMVDEKVCKYVDADYWVTDAMVGIHICQKAVGLASVGG